MKHSPGTELQRLTQTGDLKVGHLFKIAAVLDQFFWVGWHARGAVEDAEKLTGLAESGLNDVP